MRFYNRKDYLLIIGILVMIGISYQLALKKTLNAWRLNQQLKSELSQSSNIDFQPSYFARKNFNLDRLLAYYRVDTTDFRSNIISKISTTAESENVQLAEVPSHTSSYTTSYSIIQKLSFEGDYFSLMRVFQQLTRMKEAGVIRSVNLKCAKKTEGILSKKIILEIYLQSSIN